MHAAKQDACPIKLIGYVVRLLKVRKHLLPPIVPNTKPSPERVARTIPFFITHDRIARPAVAVPRLSLSSTDKVVYTLNTPYRDGTTQVAFDPVDFIARLAALVPKPRVNLTRYHGVLAPNHRWRGLATPARRGKGIESNSNAEVCTPA